MDTTPELAAIYDTVNNSFVSKATEFQTEIGDTKQTDFYPQVKVIRWSNEANYSIRLVDSDPTAPVLTIDKEKILYDKPALTATFADTQQGFEFAVVLKAPPSANVLAFTIQTKNLDFLFQPPLTDEEKKNGARRADNVEGSYAVYHSTKKDNQYKTGKAFHLFRPQATDAKGNQVWCDLSVDTDNGLMTHTIPQAFLDNAIYPVTVK